MKADTMSDSAWNRLEATIESRGRERGRVLLQRVIESPEMAALKQFAEKYPQYAPPDAAKILKLSRTFRYPKATKPRTPEAAPAATAGREVDVLADRGVRSDTVQNGNGKHAPTAIVYHPKTNLRNDPAQRHALRCQIVRFIAEHKKVTAKQIMERFRADLERASKGNAELTLSGFLAPARRLNVIRSDGRGEIATYEIRSHQMKDKFIASNSPHTIPSPTVAS
jgi:hypothetical protein